MPLLAKNTKLERRRQFSAERMLSVRVVERLATNQPFWNRWTTLERSRRSSKHVPVGAELIAAPFHPLLCPAHLPTN
jgi:hypothetical protein